MIGSENYTMTIYEIINNFFTREEVENWFKDYELTDYLTTEQIYVINQAGIWSKDKLARKIVDHFMFEQIGFETMALFRHQAKVKMQELMELNLPLIYSSAIDYDPLVNVDYTETLERTIENSGNSSGLSVGSDTPQGQISKLQFLKEIMQLILQLQKMKQKIILMKIIQNTLLVILVYLLLLKK